MKWQSREVGEMVYATHPGYMGGVFGNRPGWTITTLEPERALVLKNWGAFGPGTHARRRNPFPHPVDDQQ
jgi:hypothetical protein